MFPREPECAQAFLVLGTIQLNRGKLDQAGDLFKIAITFTKADEDLISLCSVRQEAITGHKVEANLDRCPLWPAVLYIQHYAEYLCLKYLLCNLSCKNLELEKSNRFIIIVMHLIIYLFTIPYVHVVFN